MHRRRSRSGRAGTCRPPGKPDGSREPAGQRFQLGAGAQGRSPSPATSGFTLQNGVNWLVGTTGIESGWLNIIALALAWGSRMGYRPESVLGSQEFRMGGTDGARSVALKQASASWQPGAAEPHRNGRGAVDGRALARCGWNYGCPARWDGSAVLPETTALAGQLGGSDLGKAFDLGLRQIGETPSPWRVADYRDVVTRGDLPELWPSFCRLTITAVGTRGAGG
jgi:hypothetical protein